jgi:hypothetical protein
MVAPCCLSSVNGLLIMDRSTVCCSPLLIKRSWVNSTFHWPALKIEIVPFLNHKPKIKQIALR